ncbi:MAG TPA: hypothetical protein VJ870_09470, partial [Amycolatopsis sp.]|nr:hypothetical protein [Amycolatopsis sp.]
MDGTQIYQNFTSGNSSSLQAASDVIKQLSDGYKDEADAIKALQTRMNSAWTGSSGDAATAGANPLAQAFIDSAPPLDTTTKSMHMQSEVFDTSKSKVVEVPPAPSKPSGWSVGLKAAIPIVGPSMAAGDVQSYEQGVAATDAANENNVRVMQQYSSVTNDTRGSIPMDYKTLPVDGASVGLKPATPAIIEPLNHEQYVDRTSTSSTSSSPSTSSTSSVDPVRSGPNLTGPGTTTSSGHPAYVDPHTTPPKPDAPTSTGSTGRSNTGTSQYVPGITGYGDATQRPSADRATTSTPGTSTPGRNSAAGRLYGAEGGSAKAGSTSGRGGSAGESVGRGAGGAAGENARPLGA